MTPLSQLPAFVHVGSKVFPFFSYENTSKAYLNACEATGATVSGATGPRALDCEILDKHGRTVAFVSYNGKIWGGCAYKPDGKLIYDPYKKISS
jgi:hypothetical protein